MSIYRTGYDTTLGMGLVIKPIEHAIKEAIVDGVLNYMNLDLISSLNFLPIFVTGQSSREANIPFFAHPMVIENMKGKNYLCHDIRSFIKPEESGDFNTVTPRNIPEFNLAKLRMILNLAWLTGSTRQLKSALEFAGVVFASWLSESIGKRFALDPADQLKLMIVSHYYYQSLFYPEDKFEENDLQLFAVHTIKATKADSRLVFSIFDKIGKVNSIADYCEAVKAVLENIRLKDLNVGLLITILGQSWFGLNAKEIIAVSLEHPPTWIAIVYSALNERTYRNLMISKIADRYSKHGAGEEFLKNLKNLIGNYVKTVSTEDLKFNTFE